MTTLNVVEFEEMALDNNGNLIQVPICPPVASQNVTFTTSTQSSALNDRTRFVMVLSSGAAYIKFGANPTAVAGDIAIPGEVPLFFGVRKGASLKVAALDR